MAARADIGPGPKRQHWLWGGACREVEFGSYLGSVLVGCVRLMPAAGGGGARASVDGGQVVAAVEGKEVPAADVGTGGGRRRSQQNRTQPQESRRTPPARTRPRAECDVEVGS